MRYKIKWTFECPENLKEIELDKDWDLSYNQAKALATRMMRDRVWDILCQYGLHRCYPTVEKVEKFSMPQVEEA